MEMVFGYDFKRVILRECFFLGHHLLIMVGEDLLTIFFYKKSCKRKLLEITDNGDLLWRVEFPSWHRSLLQCW